MLTLALKMLHLLGLTLFLGSIFSHIVTSALGGEPGTTATFIAAREHILTATRWLTLPGLALTILSGMALTWLKYRTRPPRWLQVHALLAGMVLALSLVVVVPAAQQTLKRAQAAQNSQQTATVADIARAKNTEDVVGGVNILLTLTIMSLGVMRPQLSRRAHEH